MENISENDKIHKYSPTIGIINRRELFNEKNEFDISKIIEKNEAFWNKINLNFSNVASITDYAIFKIAELIKNNNYNKEFENDVVNMEMLKLRGCPYLSLIHI